MQKLQIYAKQCISILLAQFLESAINRHIHAHAKPMFQTSTTSRIKCHASLFFFFLLSVMPHTIPMLHITTGYRFCVFFVIFHYNTLHSRSRHTWQQFRSSETCKANKAGGRTLILTRSTRNDSHSFSDQNQQQKDRSFIPCIGN